MIRNASINIYNKRNNENRIVSYSDNLEEICGEQAIEDDKNEQAAECTPLLNSLPPKYYSVVECLVIRDYTVTETAEKLGITEANVRKRYERARKMMRQGFEQA